MRRLVLLLVFLATPALATEPAQQTTVVRDIGSRRELFVDRFLIDRLDKASLKLHEPQLAPPMTEPADNLEYGTVIKDGDLFRLYTRDGRGAKFDGDAAEVTRYCESRDGIHWTKPKLGLHEIDGSRENNVILHEPPFCHNFAPFLDARPGVASDVRFKALAGTVKSGLVAFVSGDGIRWRKLRPEPVIPSRAPFPFIHLFDSQNVAFWSEAEGCYVCYFRVWDGLRRIARTVSPDFRTWSPPVLLAANLHGEHLYTSQTHPYFRAPHLYIAFPTRFHQERGESTDILFMTTRGGGSFDRTFREAFIRPGLDPARWGNRSNYAAWNVVPTGPAEMSIYTTPFRRFTLRLDGFASVHAGADAGEIITHPLRFVGKELVINGSSSAGGSVRIELQTAAGQPIPGFTLADSVPFVGDAIEQPLAWRREKAEPTKDLANLAGRPVRLRFELVDADLYSIQFR
jgi:hypothetical protein